MKIKYVLGIGLAALALASCSDDTMDRINKDEAHPAAGSVVGKLTIPQTEVSLVYNLLGSDYAWYVSSFTEQTFGTGNNQLKNAELRAYNELASSATFDNGWNYGYQNLLALKQIVDKCQEGGPSSGQHDVEGIAQALEALNWGILTDLHGDIPCSEALQENNSQPKLDSQKDVYDRIFALLDSAEANLALGGKNVGSLDLIQDEDGAAFSGDAEKWTALVHALRARYLLHTYGVNKSVLPQVISEAQAAVNGGFNGAILNTFDPANNVSSWYAYTVEREYTAGSTTVDNLLKDREDPRETIYNFPFWYGIFEMGEDKLGTPGNEADAQSQEVLNIPGYCLNASAYLHLFSRSEIYFILAEAKARLGQDAKSDFESGVRSAMKDWFATGKDIDEEYYYGLGQFSTTDTELTDDLMTAYLDGIAAKYEANPLQEIMVQKYLAQCRDEEIETYNDIRRCMFVDGKSWVTLTNPKNTQGGQNRWPYRLPYGASDVTNNPNVAAAFGTGNESGAYIFTKKVWWAGGE